MISLEQYIERYLKIKTKNGQITNLEMNTAQKKVYEVFKEKYNREEPCKIIILKARQMGISTVIEAIISSLTMTHYYMTSLIVAHKSDSTAHIYDMAKLYYDELPPSLKPMVKYSNARLLDFQNPTQDVNEKQRNTGLRSSIRVATAGEKGVGRSETFNYMHLSELAFWDEKDGQTVQDQLTGLLQTIPNGQSFLAIESTANGYNYFKSLWDAAVRGDNDFIPIFIPWFEMEEYRMESRGIKFTPEEEEVKEKYHLDYSQLAWRRYAIRNLCGGDIDRFHQEYPSTPDEAFIMSGNPYFNVGKLTERLGKVSPCVKRGMFSSTGNFYEDYKGAVEIWKEPVDKHVYAIGADTAGEGSDFFVAYVIDKTSMEQVAKYRSQTDEGLFVEQLRSLGYYYNFAMLAPECNFSSYPTMKLQELGYLNMYVRESEDTYQVKYAKKYGFRTTTLTRPIILSMLNDLIRDHADKINDRDFLTEALSFVKNDQGKPEAASGSHDDCVMAMAIAYYVLDQARESFTSEEEEVPDYVTDFLNYGG